jgi:hypothetical protein
LLRDTYANVQAHYVNGVPLHRLESAQHAELQTGASSIFVVEWPKFKAMSTLEIQKIFKTRHIHVLNAPVETLNFDREGLETLGSLTISRSVQGKSYRERCL